MKNKVFRGRGKTRLSAAIAVLMALSLTTWASEAGAANVPIKLQLWGDTSIAEKQFAQYLKSFPKESAGQTLIVSSAGKGDQEALQKFRLQLAAGKNIPDIIQLNYSALPEFAEAGVLADISPYVKKYLANVTPAARTLMTYNKKYFAFPYEVKAKLWFYRTDLFKQAGIDVTTVKTQSDFIAAGKKLQTVAPNSSMWNLGTNPAQYAWAMIVSGNGASYSQKTPCKITVGTDKGTAAAFRAIKDLRESGVVNTKFDDWTPEWQAGLADGTIASTLLASWFPQFLQQYAPDLAGKWGVTTWPTIGGAKGGSESAGSVFVITKASKNKAAAAAFLANSLMTKKGAKDFALANPGYLPNVESALNDPAIRNSKYFGTSLVDAYKAASKSYSIFPFDPAALKETSVLQAQMALYLASNEKDPSSFLKTAQEELTAQVGCPFKK